MKIFSLILVLIALKVIKKIISWISLYFDDNYRNSYLKCGSFGRNYLSSELLNPQFENWCRDFLIKLGYKNVICKSEVSDGGINLITDDENGVTYVYTKLNKQKNSNDMYSCSKEIDNYEEISLKEAQKFIGALAHDGVTRGIIITTGDFHKDTVDYIANLSPIYKIKLIDGLTLTKEWRRIRKAELRKGVY